MSAENTLTCTIEITKVQQELKHFPVINPVRPPVWSRAVLIWPSLNTLLNLPRPSYNASKTKTCSQVTKICRPVYEFSPPLEGGGGRSNDLEMGKGIKEGTRPDTRPPVADGWAGAEMRVFPLFSSSVTDRPTNQPTNQPTDRQSLL